MSDTKYRNMLVVRTSRRGKKTIEFDKEKHTMICGFLCRKDNHQHIGTVIRCYTDEVK